ncbi:MAG: polysaccharide deacetylase family protein [Ignavibacteriales bacterium]|nr:polysaccharide deacetylase family protein [Ignavibacteriales bacterium]
MKRVIAVTFDDLPMVRSRSNEDTRAITIAIINAVKKHHIPAVGFVNTAKLEMDGKLSLERQRILNLWLENELELGNHTYSHPEFHSVSPEIYFADIIRGETPLKEMIEKAGGKLTYFRHPYLHTGRSIALKDSLQAFLINRGYTIALVTIDNAEWIFAAAYDKADKAKDSLLSKQVAKQYIEYMLKKIQYFEICSNELFGRNIAHILLLHANRLNADYFDKLAAALEHTGYSYTTLASVLEDTAYKSADTFTGGGGISWLHRWAKTAGKGKDFFKGEPECPANIMQIAEVDGE